METSTTLPDQVVYPIVRCRYNKAGTDEPLLYIDTAVIPRVGEFVHIENHTLPTNRHKALPRLFQVEAVFHDIVRKDKYDDLNVIVWLRPAEVSVVTPWKPED